MLNVKEKFENEALFMRDDETTLIKWTEPLSQMEEEREKNAKSMFLEDIKSLKGLNRYLYHLILVYVLIQFREKTLIGKGGHNNV